MKAMRRVTALVVALGLGVGPARASEAAPAGDDVVAVLPVVVRGRLDEHMARTLEQRLATGLRRGAFTVVPAEEVRGHADAGECAGECVRRVAAATGASHVVRAEVGVEGRDYAVRVVLVRADTGEAVVTSEELCEICGYEELAVRVDDLAAALRRKLPTALEAPPRLRVLTRPEGGAVTIDGAAVGVTPLDVTVTAGVHDVVVERAGYVTLRRRITAAGETTVTIAEELAAARGRRLAPVGWAAVALGVAAVGGGAGLIAVDERPIRRTCSGANVDADGDCKFRLDTLAGGATLVVAGALALVVGATLVAIDRRRERRSRVAALGTGLVVRF